MMNILQQNMNNSPDDMQLTPPSAGRKRRAPFDEPMGDSSTSSNENSSNHSILWQQAFKRLRVGDQENYMYSSHGYSGGSHPPWPQQQRPSSSPYATPPPKPPAQEPPPETDYKKNNQVLGQLHRERRLREQEEARRQYMMDGNSHGSRSNSNNNLSSIYCSQETHDSRSTGGSSISDQDTWADSPAVMDHRQSLRGGGVHLFGTPMAIRQQRNQHGVVHLKTDSKLE